MLSVSTTNLDTISEYAQHARPNSTSCTYKAVLHCLPENTVVFWWLCISLFRLGDHCCRLDPYESTMWNYYIQNIVAKIALLNIILGIGLKLHGHGNEYLTLWCWNSMPLVTCKRPELKLGLHKNRYLCNVQCFEQYTACYIFIIFSATWLKCPEKY